MIKVTKKQLVLKRKETGASLIEYAVIAALIVGVAIAAFGTLETGLGTVFTNIVTAITGAGQ